MNVSRSSWTYGVLLPQMFLEFDSCRRAKTSLEKSYGHENKRKIFICSVKTVNVYIETQVIFNHFTVRKGDRRHKELR